MFGSNIDRSKKYYTRDGVEVLSNNVFEIDKDGYVIWSVRWKIIDFNKSNNESKD